MASVSRGVANRIYSDVLERMTCDGRLLMDLVRRQKYDEEESLKTWKLPVQIVSPLIALTVILLIIYAIRQRVQYLHILTRDDWKINFFEIDFSVPKKRRWATSRTADDNKDASTPSHNCPGRWNVHEVVARPLSIARVFDVNRKVNRVLMRMREEIEHENVARFFGISSQIDAVYLVEHYCANGTLIDFLHNNKYSVNQAFRYVVCADIANGMAYLHRQNLVHGNLSTDKCHVDSRWTIKIVDWEYTALYDVVRRSDRNRTQPCTREKNDKNILRFLYSDGSLLFRHLAPEIKNGGRLLEPTRAGDVYSFGIITRDVFTNSPGRELRQPGAEDGDTMPAKARQIMELACCETAVKRPTFQQLEKSMRSIVTNGQTNLLDR